MNITQLSLINFRNYRSLDLALPKGLLVLHGANAQGKTNFLDAVYLISIAKSYRVTHERELVHWDALAQGEMALVTVNAETHRGPLQVRVGFRYIPRPESEDTNRRHGNSQGHIEKRIRVNGIPRLASELVGQVNAVLFTATDMELVQGSPAIRRRFLDILISQVDHVYMRALQRYQRVLYQRNHLLRMVRDRRGQEEDLAFWDSELIKEGTIVTCKRQHVVSTLSRLARETYGQLAQVERLEIAYRPSVDEAHTFEKALQGSRSREMVMGVTLVGPHRDDFQFFVEGVDMGTYASRGEARTIALALRLSEASFLHQERGEEPILLLDDVLSELDPERRHLILTRICGYEQVLLTTTDPHMLEKNFRLQASLFTVKDGVVAHTSAN